MKAQVILPADYRVTPWRNGTGKTAEIAVAPGEGSRFAWRLSIADVPESGPFSDYPGYERIIAVVDAYDAMTQDRTYRMRLDSCDAVAEIVRCSPSHFDPEIVDAFLAVLSRH